MNKSKIEEVTIIAPAKDIKTLKATNAIDKDDTVKVSDKNVSQTSSYTQPTTSTQNTSVTEDLAPITPQDPATIKYLSNVKDDKTGEVSKPFNIKDKKYQMVRGMNPNKEVVMAVYCFDDKDSDGNNIIHPMEYFEEHIAKKAIKEDGYDHAAAERDFHDKENLKVDEPKSIEKPVAKPEVKQEPKKENTNSSLKLSEFKHFCVDKKTGKVRKFKRVEELAKASMTEDETYMNLSQFKKHVDEALFGSKQKPKSDIVETDINDRPENAAVKKAMDEILIKVKPYLSKLVEPMEKVQFIVKLTDSLQLEASKYPTLITALKKAGDSKVGAKDKTPSTSSSPSTTTNASTTTNPSTVQSSPTTTENKVMTKDELTETILKGKVIKTIKVKDIK